LILEGNASLGQVRLATVHIFQEIFMYPSDVLQASWAIAAKHLAKGQKDPILMVAEGIMQERQKWQIEANRTTSQENQ
jgi:hypothetical protein